MDVWLAVVLGILQGIFEWLPISSEGNVALYLRVVEGRSPAAATGLALFLHAGTAVAALAYYRGEVAGLARALPDWRPATADDALHADLTFLAVATLVSGVVGITAYLTLEALFPALAGGAFIVVIGLLLVVTGLLQKLAEARLGTRTAPTLPDALLVGALQGLAILPGVSRSGTTVSALLLRGYEPPAAFRLSFLLSIPAALGAGVLVVAADGLAVSPLAGAVALVTAAVVGYLTIDALMRVVHRVAFWKVCLGLGGLAILGGVLTAI